MLIFKEFILLALVILTVHAGHKRIIIKVPLRTRHIYHHQVKKVPVYVILPENKPKVILDLEAAIKPKTTEPPAPCKDPEPEFEEYSPHYGHARYSYSEKDSYHPDWTEDPANKGAFIPVEEPKELGGEFQPPPVGSDDHIYDYGQVKHRIKKSKKTVARKSIPDTKYSRKLTPYWQHYSKSIPDQQQHSNLVSEQKPYSEWSSNQQQYSKSVPEVKYYSESIPDQQQYSKSVPEVKHYTESIPDQQHYSKSVPEVKHYTESIPDQQHYSKSVPEVKYYSESISDQQHYSKSVPKQQYYSTSIPDHQHLSKSVHVKQYASSYDNSGFLPSSYRISNEPEHYREYAEHYTLPPYADADFGNSANSYASSYQYRINHR